MGDFDRVFEVGPYFRAETCFTHRHMCEFTGLDIEMTIKENYLELLDFMAELFVYIFNQLEENHQKEINSVKEQFPFEPFKCKYPVVKITFQEGVELLKQAGIEQNPLEDIDTTTEKKLGEIVKEVNYISYIRNTTPIST